MKKVLVLALVVSFVLSLAGTALAFPVDFTGDFRLQGRSIDDKTFGITTKDGSWWQLRGRMNFTGKIDDSTTFFGRFSTRSDFGKANTSSTEFDQYGVKIAAGDWKFSIGRQAVSLGQGSIISTGSDAAGVDNKFDGLVATSKSGKVDFSIIAGKTTPVNYPDAWEYYGGDASVKLDDKFSVGLAYAHAKPGILTPANIWALNTTFTPSSNFTFNGEYSKSDWSWENKAFFVAGTYSWDKDSFTVQYNKVERNAFDQWNSGIGAVAYPFWGNDLNVTGYKGFTLVYSHPFTKAASFHIIYMDLKGLQGFDVHDKELGAGVVWKF